MEGKDQRDNHEKVKMGSGDSEEDGMEAYELPLTPWRQARMSTTTSSRVQWRNMY